MKCAIYARVSTDEQGTSIVNQQEYFKDYIQRNGFEIFDIYNDEAFSGTETTKRLSFQRLLEDGKNKRYDVLLAKSYSRFGRNQRETLTALALLFEYGIRIIFVEDGLDSLRDKGQFGLFAWLAEQEARKISERIKLTWQLYNQQGKIHNTKETYGYRYNRDLHNFVVVEKEAEIVRSIFNLYLEGNSLRTIAMFLNDKKYPTKHKSRWFSKVIRDMLQNEFYLGHLIQGKNKKIDVTIKKTEYVEKKKWFIHKNNHEGIITEEIFNAVQKEMKKRAEYRKSENPTRQSTAYLFSNLLRCKICNYGFTHRKRSNGKRLSYYLCSAYASLGYASGHGSNQLSERKIVASVKSGLEALANNDFKMIRDYFKRKCNEDNIKAETLTIKNMDEEIAEQTQLSLSLLNAYTDGILGKMQFKLQNEAIEEKINALMQQREEILFQQEKTAFNADAEGETITAVTKLLEMDVSQWNNALMKKIINKIYMDIPNNDIEILFNYTLLSN